MKTGSVRRPRSAASWLRDQSVRWTGKRGCDLLETGLSWRNPRKRDRLGFGPVKTSEARQANRPAHHGLQRDDGGIEWGFGRKRGALNPGPAASVVCFARSA